MAEKSAQKVGASSVLSSSKVSDSVITFANSCKPWDTLTFLAFTILLQQSRTEALQVSASVHSLDLGRQ
jgi:hypothetical protein